MELAPFRRGDRVRVFDHLLWNGKDCTCCPDNGCYRKPATVRDVRLTVDGWVVDVEFDHRHGGVSRGHFARGVESLGTYVQV
jgi:hypothetical protein